MNITNCIKRVASRILNNSINDNQLNTIIKNKSDLFSLNYDEFALLLEREIERQSPALYLYKIYSIFLNYEYTTELCEYFLNKKCVVSDIKLGGIFDIYVSGYYIENNEEVEFRFFIKLFKNIYKYSIVENFNNFLMIVNNYCNYNSLMNNLPYLNLNIPIGIPVSTCNNIYFANIDISTLDYNIDDLKIINTLYNSHNLFFKQF